MDVLPCHACRAFTVMGMVLPPEEAVNLMRALGAVAAKYNPGEVESSSRQQQRICRARFLKGITLTGRIRAR